MTERWVCNLCTLLNRADNGVCEACNNERRKRENIITCEACTLENDEKERKCGACGARLKKKMRKKISDGDDDGNGHSDDNDDGDAGEAKERVFSIFAKGFKEPPPPLVTYIDNILDPDVAEQVLDHMLRLDCWHEASIKVWGKQVVTPRLTQTWALEVGTIINYSHYSAHAKEMDDVLRSVALEVEKAVHTHQRNKHVPQGDQWKANYVVGNLYRDKDDGVGWHSDNFAESGPMSTIASLTLGCQRVFQIKPRDGHGKQIYNYVLAHNSLLIMWPGVQERYQHSIPKGHISKTHKTALTKRINLTYRHHIYDMSKWPLLANPRGPSSSTAPVCPKCQQKPAQLMCTHEPASPNMGRYFWSCTSCERFVQFEDRIARFEYDRLIK